MMHKVTRNIQFSRIVYRATPIQAFQTLSAQYFHSSTLNMSFVTEKGTAQLAPGCESGRTCEKYPEVAAYQSGTLPEEDGHNVYYACYGNPEGKPVIYVHGGPGGGTTPGDAGYFDLEKWHVCDSMGRFWSSILAIFITFIPYHMFYYNLYTGYPI